MEENVLIQKVRSVLREEGVGSGILVEKLFRGPTTEGPAVLITPYFVGTEINVEKGEKGSPVSLENARLDLTVIPPKI